MMLASNVPRRERMIGLKGDDSLRASDNHDGSCRDNALRHHVLATEFDRPKLAETGIVDHHAVLGQRIEPLARGGGGPDW